MSKVLDFRKWLAKYQEWFFMPFVIVMGGLMSFGSTSEEKIYLICFAIVSLLLGIKIVITDYTKRELVLVALLGVLLAVNFLINGEKTLIISFMAIVGVKGINVEKVLKWSLWTKLGLTLLRIGLVLAGVIENEVIYLPKNGARTELLPINCYGYYSANILCGNIITILLLFYIVYKEKMKWYMYFIFSVIVYFACEQLYCRTGLGVWAAFGALLFLNWALKKTKVYNEYLRLISFMPIYMMVIMYFLAGLSYNSEGAYGYRWLTQESAVKLMPTILYSSIAVLIAVTVYILLIFMFKKRNQKVYAALCNIVAPAMFGGAVWFMWLALNSQALPSFIVNFAHEGLTSRFGHIGWFLDRAKFDLIGNSPREVFDSIYFHAIYNYGWIIALIFVASYIGAIWHYIKKQRVEIVIVLSTLAIYGMMEMFPLSVTWNVPLLYLGSVLFKESKENKEDVEKMNSFYKKNKTIETYGFIGINLFSTAFSYVLACYFRFWAEGTALRDRGVWFEIFALCFVGCIIYNVTTTEYRNFFRRGIFDEFCKVIRYVMVLFLCVSAYVYIFDRGKAFSRLMLVYFIILTGMLSFVLRCIFRSAMKAYYWSTGGSDRIMIVSKKENAEEVIKKIKSGGEWSYNIAGVALIDGDSSVESIDGIPVVASLENAAEVGRQSTLDAVIFDCADCDTEKVEVEIKEFLSMGVVVHNCVDIRSMDAPYSSIERFAEMPVVTYSMTMVDYRRRIIKRIMDIAGGFIGLIILILVTPFLALAIKLDSKGPVFFSQTRIGRNGRRFKMYKFRSMYVDAEERKKELMDKNQMSGLMFKMDDDPRITKVGKFIRKTSLDELPQFWNVLKGDMSLVGTRPPTVDEYEQYSSYYRRRLSTTPGLTGLWQVSGRSDIEDFDEVVKLDLEYIDGWSVRKDIKILIKTIGVVLGRKGSK